MSRMISVGSAPRLIVDDIGGDISVVGWEGNEILVKADDEEIHLEQNGEEVRMTCRDDVSLRVPKASSLYFTAIRGDAAVRGVSGPIEIKEIHGDLSMREVGSVSIDSIQADFIGWLATAWMVTRVPSRASMSPCWLSDSGGLFV